MTKLCRLCGPTEGPKPLTDFAIKRKDQRQSYCRPCQREYRKKHYAANHEKYRSRIRENKRELRQWFSALKATLKCARCPETHPACLDFHHKDPSEKDFNLSQIGTYGWSRETILAELNKCEVLCSNCHRKEHAEQVVRA